MGKKGNYNYYTLKFYSYEYTTDFEGKRVVPFDPNYTTFVIFKVKAIMLGINSQNVEQSHCKETLYQ